MGTFKNPDVWKQNLAYQIGDFVLYYGTVYMAIKPVPAGTEMSADYWTEFAEGAIVPTGEISITENGEVDVAQYATANVNVEGGGGSSDFTTATVTYTLTGGKSDLFVEAAVVKETEESGKFSEPFFQTEETSGFFTIILYGGKAYTGFGESIVTVVSGDAEADGSAVIISGDCVVTVDPD